MFTSRHLKFTIAAALSVTLLSACNNQGVQSDGQIASNIIGGRASTARFQKENGVVGLVSMTMQGGISACTASLIAKRVLLTAAHCVPANNLVTYAVFTTDINTFMETLATDISKLDEMGVMVDRAEINTDYNSTARDPLEAAAGDVAVVFLKADAPAEFKVAKLPTADLELQGKAVTLAGFGVQSAIRNSARVNPQTGELGIGRLPESKSGELRQVDDLNVLFANPDKTAFLVTGGTEVKGACSGDSGGPAYLKQANGSMVLVGVASNIMADPFENCNRGLSFYAGVPKKLDWIKTQLAAHEAAQQPATPQ